MTTMAFQRRRRPTKQLATALVTAAAILFTSLPQLAVAASAAGGGAQQQQCERLPTSLTYSQDSAPADVSAILRVVVDKINRDVTGVVDVEVAWTGAELHKRVGERIVRCTVTRLAESINDAEGEGGTPQSTSTVDEHGREVVTQCFEVPFTILDVNECSVSKSNAMAHRCHAPSVCVNTLGSYECVCPAESHESAMNNLGDGTGAALSNFWQQLNSEARNSWELSLGSSTESSCPNSSSTHGCCDEDGHSKDGKFCRTSFRCPIDPCTKTKRAAACAADAICQRTSSPLSQPNYNCQCPDGLMGNGYPCRGGNQKRRVEPMVKYDGVTPTEETRRALDANLICGCVEAKVDACDGFPKCPGKHEMCAVRSDNTPHCTCQEGYDHDPDYGCVDESPPILTLRPDPTHPFDPNTGITHLSQGDRYEEYGVNVVDDNAEEYLRSLKMSYSRPLPQGCLSEMGQFYVNYTVATPWTTPEFVSAKRTVVIDNVNECQVKASVGVGANCPELVAMCDVEAGAMCKDEVGTYTCTCPKGTKGDGFLAISRLISDGSGGFTGKMVPDGYTGGTGCRDISKPVIELLGPNPKRFRVAKTSGVKGVIRRGGGNEEGDARLEALLVEQRSAYESDIRSTIKATAGAELCATSMKSNDRPSNCVLAQDHTYKGIIDLTSRVSVGEPIPKEGATLMWRVPYNVMDDAGNEAETVWRDIIVDEVDINNFEQKAQMSVAADRREEVDRAVNEALAKERRKQHTLKKDKTIGCPPCEPCNCNNMQQQQQQTRGGNGRGMISVADCNTMCDTKIDGAVASSSSSARSAGQTCATSYLETDLNRESSHQIIQEMLVFIEGLMGPGAMMLLLLGCTLATGLYVLGRVISALFLSTGPNVRTYYHTDADDERENIMMESVSYYRSPTPPSRSNGGSRQSPGSASSEGRQTTTPFSSSSSASAARPPPTASISSQRRNNGGVGGAFSPNRANVGTAPSQQSPFHSNDGTGMGSDNIYQSMSPITPLRHTSNGTPSSSGVGSSRGSASQRSPYSNF